MPHDASSPVYLVSDRVLSMHDLLRRFTLPEYNQGGISRISDMHLKVGEPVRYRFDDELVPLPEAAPLTNNMIQSLLFPMLTKEQIGRLEDQVNPRDIDASYDWPEAQLNFRINAFRDREGLACAIRVLPRAIPPLADIGWPTSRTWEDLLTLKQGLVVVTGVTGSGKSTTIASLIQHINLTQRKRIITLEDPIEYVLPSERSLISQRELGRHIPAFHDGLRSSLREDPDIIFVGEMRDPETTSLALTAAETGHLVLSTLHTRDARGAVSRIVDMYPSERLKELTTQLSFSLSFIIAQKLVPRADGKGRRVAMEVLRNVPAVAHLIRAGNWHQLYSAMETRTKDGLGTLEKHLTELAMQGEITRETALSYANDGSIANRLK